MIRASRTIHYTQLPPSSPDNYSPEWETFRREVGRLIAEGHEGKWILLKGEQIVAMFDTEDQASEEGSRRYQLTGFLVQHVATYQPLIRVSFRYQFPCPIRTTP